jgi:hypothetical protein
MLSLFIPRFLLDKVTRFTQNIEWGKTLKVAGGVNLCKTNNPALLKKVLKHKAKKKSSSAKAWNSRTKRTKDAIAGQQRIRSHNMDQRKLGSMIAANLSSKRIIEKNTGEGGDCGGNGRKAKKRLRLGLHSNQGGNRAGFEGKESGFINGKGAGGNGCGGGVSLSAAMGGVGKKVGR